MKPYVARNGKPKASQPTPAEFEARSKALRSKTDERLDHLTGLWREIEKKLIALQQPREVCYVYSRDQSSDPQNPDDQDCRCIGIAKYAGKWRLCLGEFNTHTHCYHPYEAISWRPTTDCTMQERVTAAQYIGKLEIEIIETGEKMLPKLDEAIRQLEERLADHSMGRLLDELADL